MSLFPQLHKPSASPVDATSIADLRRIPSSLSLLLCRPSRASGSGCRGPPGPPRRSQRHLRKNRACDATSLLRILSTPLTPHRRGSQVFSVPWTWRPGLTSSPATLLCLLLSGTLFPGSARPLLSVIRDKCHWLRAVLSDPQSEGGSASPSRRAHSAS